MSSLRDPAGFDEAYVGVPPWDVGHPQPAIVELADAGQIVGPVLDVGCGTGENVLELAGRGIEVVGIDAAPRAVGKAIEKARARGLEADFLLADALALGNLRRSFRTVIDSGLFHVFDDDERPVFAASLASVLELGGRYHMLCFNEHVPGVQGPRRVTQDEIRDTFVEPWTVIEIVPATFDTNLAMEAVPAWRATIELTPDAAA
jgi:SAM-dependent methyltransferase